MQMALGDDLSDQPLAAPETEITASADDGRAGVAGNGHYMAPWIETEKCTSCDECIRLNPDIFAYNEQKKAVIKDPSGGPFEDLVKAAERCTAGVIHPGLPKDRSGKGMEKLIARAEKFNR